MKQIAHFIKQPFWLSFLYALCLLTASAYVLLDTFVIPHELATTSDPVQTVSSDSPDTALASQPAGQVSVTDNHYQDDRVTIDIATERANETTFYVVDIQLTSAAYLNTAFAQQSYGRNIKETTSTIATEQNAILAINGDYYGFRDTGYVVRNGETYRATPWQGTEALVIDTAGNFSTFQEDELTLDQITAAQEVQQVLSFGPTLVKDGQLAVSTTSEVGQSKTSNPRTAIGQIDDLHYLMIVSDGRTTESEGLTLYQLAQEFESRGATIAYNLDGGGSSTLWFNGKVINKPTDGRQLKERAVSDIIYIGD